MKQSSPSSPTPRKSEERRRRMARMTQLPHNSAKKVVRNCQKLSILIAIESETDAELGPQIAGFSAAKRTHNGAKRRYQMRGGSTSRLQHNFHSRFRDWPLTLLDRHQRIPSAITLFCDVCPMELDKWTIQPITVRLSGPKLFESVLRTPIQSGEDLSRGRSRFPRTPPHTFCIFFACFRAIGGLARSAKRRIFGDSSRPTAFLHGPVALLTADPRDLCVLSRSNRR